MTEDEQLRHRIEELSAACTALEDERSVAEAPVRAHFAPELTTLSDDAKHLTHTLARHTQAIGQNTQQREAFERARLFAVWQSARGVGVWVLVLSVSAFLSQTRQPWSAALPVAFAVGVSMVFKFVARRLP